MKHITKRTIVASCILIVAMLMTISVFAASSNQLYIHNSSPGFVKMTGSLYGYTSNSTRITLGSAITRTDFISGQTHLYDEARLTATLYENYDRSGSLADVFTGDKVATSSPSDATPIGDYITTTTVSVNATCIGSMHSMKLPNDDMYVETLGMIINNGTLERDSKVK